MLKDLLMNQAGPQHCSGPHTTSCSRPHFSAFAFMLTDGGCFLQYSMGIPYQSSKSCLNMQTAVLSNE